MAFYLFGNDTNKQIIKINIKMQGHIYFMEQIDPPINLGLYDYMGGCKIDDYIYFLAGGLSAT